MSDVPQCQQLVRLAPALALGSILGWERQKADQPVGVRTTAPGSDGLAGLVLITSAVVARVGGCVSNNEWPRWVGAGFDVC